MPIRGAIFDLDGTLVDSGLDFDLMRREMGLPPGLPLLEAIAALAPDEAEQCWAILLEHERRGAQRARPYAGVAEFLAALAQRNWRRAVFTRNSRELTNATLSRLNLDFDEVKSREDGPVKPDPAAIWQICESWRLPPRQCVIIGDHRMDIEAGRRAGTHTVLFTGSGLKSGMRPGEQADFVLESFQEVSGFWQWVDQIGLEGAGASC
jgi:HAD superfamily hydrolase (TIGR01509 family)